MLQRIFPTTGSLELQYGSMYQASVHANDIGWKPARFSGVGHVFFGKDGIPHGPQTTVNGSIVLILFSGKLDVHVVT